MNPGIPEEAGKVATSAIDALKATPVVLALVIFNVLFMALAVFISVRTGDRWERETQHWREMAEVALKICPTSQKP